MKQFFKFLSFFVLINLMSTLQTKVFSNTALDLPFQDLIQYPDGAISEIYNAGPGLALDDKSTTSEDSKMVVISSTNSTSFNSFIDELLNKGFTNISDNKIGNITGYLLEKNNQAYYIYFNNNKNEVRIIQENSSRSLLSEIDTELQGDGSSEFYLYSLDYTHGEGQTSKLDYWRIDCGAMLIVKLKDNSLFVIDAGHQRQSSNAALEGLLDFMYKITGQEVGSKINIRSWFFSHAHGDHVYGVYPFITKYNEFINVESVMFNFPSYQIMKSGYDTGTFLMKQTFNTYYPNCKFVKLHTGQSFTLQGIKFDVLFTHEDAVDTTGKNVITDFNDTSTILKMFMDGKSFMLLGDGGSRMQSSMTGFYSRAILKSDCVQTAHHGYNDLSSLYSFIQAPVALYCNSYTNAVINNLKKYQGVINATRNVKTFYADPNTIKITVENNEFVIDSVPGYRSLFKIVEVPKLDVVNISRKGNSVPLQTVLSQNSLNKFIIDKSAVGTPGKNSSETCAMALDGKTETKFCTDSIPATIAWTMKKPVILKWYVLYTANDNEKFHGRNPQQWILFGSNDGVDWEGIDSVSNANIPNTNFTGVAYTVTNQRAYQYYAIKFQTTNGAAIMQISEISLYGEEGESTNSVNNVEGTNDPHVFSYQNKIIINYPHFERHNAYISIFDLMGREVINHQINRTVTDIQMSPGLYLVNIKNNLRNYTYKIFHS